MVMLELMSEAIYESLAKALDRLPNGYPRTDSGVEILILKKIFSAEEAASAAAAAGFSAESRSTVWIIPWPPPTTWHL
jgi:hypothetical protein